MRATATSPRSPTPDGNTVKRTCDADGNLATVEDCLGHKIRFAYEADSNQEQQIPPGGVTAASSYDANNDLTKILDTNAEGQLASFDADAWSNCVLAEAGPHGGGARVTQIANCRAAALAFPWRAVASLDAYAALTTARA